MGKINGCIKGLFIGFNAVFEVIGCMMIIGLLKTSYSHQLKEVGSQSLVWAWVFAISILCISSLGVFAGRKENALALKIFAGFMGVGMIIMMIFGIIVAVERNKMKNSIKDVKSIMNDNARKEALKQLQQEAKCCGLVSAEDWGHNIPSSCGCYNQGGSQCKSKPQGTSGPSFIYKQTCGEVIFESVSGIYKISMGVCFGFAVTALLGLLMSLQMIQQIKRHDNTGGASFAVSG